MTTHETRTGAEMVRDVFNEYVAALDGIDVLTSALDMLDARNMELTLRNARTAARAFTQDPTERKNALRVIDDTEHATTEPEDSVAMAYFEDILEAVIHGQRTLGGEWRATELEFLLAYGGPTVRMTNNGSAEYVRLTVTWAGDEHSARVYAPATAAFMSEMLDAYAE